MISQMLGLQGAVTAEELKTGAKREIGDPSMISQMLVTR